MALRYYGVSTLALMLQAKSFKKHVLEIACDRLIGTMKLHFL